MPALQLNQGIKASLVSCQKWSIIGEIHDHENDLQVSNTWRETIIMLLVAIVVYVGLRFSIQTYIVHGPSMEPNYTENEWLIVNKLAYRFGTPHRGDIIVFYPPIAPKTRFIKRIIGLPGESVEVKNSKVYVYKTDGTVITLDEPYIAHPAVHNSVKRTVPEGQYFVMGDNRIDSEDSRDGWYAPRASIVGKAWVSVWPPSRWGMAPNHVVQSQTVQAPAN
jgi:signal peptidase I